MLKKWLPLLIIIVLMGAFWASGAASHFNLETLHKHKDSFQNYADLHPVLSVLIFSGLYIICVTLSLPIATLLTLLGGFLFGKWWGTLIVVTAATIGATILFMIARSSFGQSLRDKAGPLYKKISDNVADNAVGYLLFLRLVPLFPFFIVNIVPALLNVPLRVYILTTFFGIIPGTFVYVNFGETLGDIESLGDLASPQTIIALALLGLFAFIPTLYKQIKNRRKTKS